MIEEFTYPYKIQTGSYRGSKGCSGDAQYSWVNNRCSVLRKYPKMNQKSVVLLFCCFCYCAAMLKRVLEEQHAEKTNKDGSQEVDPSVKRIMAFGDRCLPRSADLRRPPQTSADLRRPLQTSADLRRPPQTSADLRRPPQTSADLRRPPQTSADLRRPPQTSADLRRPPQTSADLRRPPQTSADLRRPPQTSADLRRPPQTSADLRRPPQTSADLRRPPQTSADLRRPPQTSADLRRPPQTSADLRRRTSADAPPQTHLRRRTSADVPPQTYLRRRTSADVPPQTYLRRRTSAFLLTAILPSLTEGYYNWGCAFHPYTNQLQVRINKGGHKNIEVKLIYRYLCTWVPTFTPHRLRIGDHPVRQRRTWSRDSNFF